MTPKAACAAELADALERLRDRCPGAVEALNALLAMTVGRPPAAPSPERWALLDLAF